MPIGKDAIEEIDKEKKKIIDFLKGKSDAKNPYHSAKEILALMDFLPKHFDAASVEKYLSQKGNPPIASVESKSIRYFKYL